MTTFAAKIVKHKALERKRDSYMVNDVGVLCFLMFVEKQKE